MIKKEKLSHANDLVTKLKNTNNNHLYFIAFIFVIFLTLLVGSLEYMRLVEKVSQLFIYISVVIIFVILITPSLITIFQNTRNKFLLNFISKELNLYNSFVKNNRNDFKSIKNGIRNYKIKFESSSDKCFKQVFSEILINLEELEKFLILDIKKKNLEKSYLNRKISIEKEISDKLISTPLIRTRNHLIATLDKIVKIRNKMENDWDIYWGNISLWDKMNASKPDYREINEAISDLERMIFTFNIEHRDNIEKIENFYKKKACKILSRLDNAFSHSFNLLNCNGGVKDDSEMQLQYGLWASVFSMTASATNDMYNAHALYDSLRSVNEKFSTLSDSEIWWESLWMSSESLAGLANLAKGAYFEELVASNTGGELFEHFNHANSDIIIDGVEFQLKATDSISYINSVDDEFLVISTTEVASKTDAIDSGINNMELSNITNLALGGTVIDVNDTVIDGVLGGVAGMGVLATAKGLEHAVNKFEKDRDGLEALLEGAGIAVTGTAKGIVDAGEFAYKATTSKTGKTIGSVIFKIGKVVFKLVEKIFNKV